MLKWLGIFAIMLSALAVGSLKRDELKRRERELFDFSQVLSYLENAFDCRQDCLPEAVEGAMTYCETDLYLLLESFLKKLRGAEGIRTSDAWVDALNETTLSINAEDREVLKSFGKGLDGSDFAAQKRNIAFTKKQIETCLEDARVSCKVNGKLTLQLSFLGSIAIILLLL